MYYSEQVKKVAEKLGYTLETDNQNGDSFTKSVRHIWSLNPLEYYHIQTADLIDGKFCNHKKFSNAIEALNRPIVKRLFYAVECRNGYHGLDEYYNQKGDKHSRCTRVVEFFKTRKLADKICSELNNLAHEVNRLRGLYDE